MKKLLLIFTFFIFLSRSSPSFAIEDPTKTANNKFGVHILEISELQDAAKLVNSNGGDWGYVVIPIQSGDKDIKKWQGFMDEAARLHIIPIIRLATEGDYFNTKVWRKPDDNDVIDFANFLNSLTWPTKNRYVEVFNEVNRGDEWGGIPSAQEYSDLLSFSVDTFKTKSTDFFIISAGLDNASANSATSINEYNFISQMENDNPQVFYKIDGIGSHSYPNPGFSSSPFLLTSENVGSFSYESSQINNYVNKNLPIFITETGWDQDVVGINLASSNMRYAYENIWNNPEVVSVSPFLLKAGVPPFKKFSLEDTNGNPNEVYKSIQGIEKTKGTPTVNKRNNVLGAKISASKLPTKDFIPEKKSEKLNKVEQFVKFIIGI